MSGGQTMSRELEQRGQNVTCIPRASAEASGEATRSMRASWPNRLIDQGGQSWPAAEWKHLQAKDLDTEGAVEEGVQDGGSNAVILRPRGF